MTEKEKTVSRIKIDLNDLDRYFKKASLSLP